MKIVKNRFWQPGSDTAWITRRICKEMPLIKGRIYQDDGSVNVSSAGQFIKRVKPDFDVRIFGYIKLSKLIEAFPKKYEIKRYPGKGTTTIVTYRCRENGKR